MEMLQCIISFSDTGSVFIHSGEGMKTYEAHRDFIQFTPFTQL